MKNNKGFSLIEVVIVIAMAFILFTIIGPLFLVKSENRCSIYTYSNSYIGIDKTTIKENDYSISFIYLGKSIRVSKDNTDIICNS